MILFTDMASKTAQAPITSFDGWAPVNETAAPSTVFAVYPASLTCGSGQSAGSMAAKFPYALGSGVREEPVFGRVFMSLPLGGCIREKQHRISIRCSSSEINTDPGFAARWR
jgi:hypothetical protein